MSPSEKRPHERLQTVVARQEGPKRLLISSFLAEEAPSPFWKSTCCLGPGRKSLPSQENVPGQVDILHNLFPGVVSLLKDDG